MTHPQRTQRIAALNDDFRSMGGIRGGRWVVTPRVAELTPGEQSTLTIAIMCFNKFNPDNDPYGEHDFGALELFGTDWFWKIDYYADDTCQFGSEAPADPDKCFRVLTVMHASEY